MIRTTALVLLLAALIGFAVHTEIRQNNRPLAKEQTEPAEETSAWQQRRSDSQNVVPRKIDHDLLNEAGWGRTEKVKSLLDSGAYVDARDDNGDTSLIAAAIMGSSETVKLLLERGADVNAKNNLGSTALIEAAAMDKTDIVELLLSSGADKKVTNIAGLTALDAALIEKHAEMAHLLRSGAGKRQAVPDSNSDSYAELNAALHQAAIDGDVSKIRGLLASGANVNAKNKDGRTPLILAVLQGRVDVVQLLLNNGADPNAQDKQGETAMSAVRKSGQIYIGQLLRKAGAKTPAYNQIISEP